MSEHRKRNEKLGISRSVESNAKCLFPSLETQWVWLMVIWLKRWLVYFLVPTGLVLVAFPLHTHRGETVDRAFLFLEAVGTTEDLEPSAGQTAGAETPDPRGHPVITPEDLASFPALQIELDSMVRTLTVGRQRRLNPRKIDDVPVEEWVAFTASLPGAGDARLFIYQTHVFRGRIDESYDRIQVEIEHLRLATRVVGGVFLLLSLVALRGLYAHPPTGIQVGRRRDMIIWDVATIAVGLVFAWWLVDFALEKLFQTEAEWGEAFAVGMGVFWAALMNPAVALVGTATSMQTLWISPDEIVLKGLFGRVALPWPEVETFRVLQSYSPRTVGGLPAPHRAMKVLEIAGRTASLKILEPPSASTKRKILGALQAHAPDTHLERIAVVSKEWLSRWS